MSTPFAPHALALLRARRKRPPGYSAAKRDDEFSSLNVDCRVTLRGVMQRRGRHVVHYSKIGS
jgi:hypothetical protein